MRSRTLLSCVAILVTGCSGEDAPPKASPSSTNSPPGASAGHNQVVAEGSVVVLDGTASRDEDHDVLHHTWTQTGGEAISLGGTDTATATFTAPTLTGDAGTITLTFTLTVTDSDGASDTDVVLVSVFDTNQRPVVQIAGATSANALTQVQLVSELCDPVSAECIATTDPDGSLATYSWGQPVEQIQATITPAPDGLSAMVSLPDATGPMLLRIELAATDNEGKVGIAAHLIEVQPVAAGIRFVDLDADTELVMGGTWPLFRVQVVNADDSVITGGALARLTIRIDADAGGGVLSGDTEVVAFAGEALFDDLRYDQAESGLPVRATALTTALESTVPVRVFELLPGAIGAPGANIRIDSLACTTDQLTAGGWFSTGSSDLPFAFDGASHAANSETRSADGFVVSSDQTGAIQWLTTLASSGRTAGIIDMARDGGELVVLARSNGQPSFVEQPSAAVASALGGMDLLLFSLSDMDGSVQWTTTFGGAGNDSPSAIAIDNAGNALVSGSFSGSNVDLCTAGNDLVDSAGSSDIFVLSIDGTTLAGDDACKSALAHRWSYRAGGTGVEDVTAMAYDASTDTVYVAGIFSDTVDFGAGNPLSAVPGADRTGFLLALDASDGSVLWAVSFGGDSGTTLPAGVVLDSSGAIWVAGQFAGSGDFEPGAGDSTLTAGGQSDGFVLTVDDGGVLTRARSWGGPVGTRVDVTAMAGTAVSGDPVVIGGSHTGSIDFDPGAGISQRDTASGTTGAFVMALASDGTLTWVRGIGNADDSGTRDTLQTAMSAINDGALRIYTAGQVEGPGVAVDIDPSDAVRTHTAIGSRDAVLGSLDASGSAP